MPLSLADTGGGNLVSRADGSSYHTHRPSDGGKFGGQYDPGVLQEPLPNHHDGDRLSLDQSSRSFRSLQSRSFLSSRWPDRDRDCSSSYSYADATQSDEYTNTRYHHEHGDPSPPYYAASRDSSVPLSHPTPDLQSLQGAYLSNVERLEESAEQLSLGSDIGEELRKLQMEQKRSESGHSSLRGVPSHQFSSASHTNSILEFNSVARSGGFSHEGYVTSPMSTFSPAWSMPSTQEQPSQADRQQQRQQQNGLSEPSQEGKPLDSPISMRSSIRMVPKDDDPLPLEEEEKEAHNGEEYVEITHGEAEGGNKLSTPSDAVQRNASVASKNTFQKAEEAFADFDGVHMLPDLPSPPEPEQPSQPERLAEPVERRQSVSPAYSASIIGYGMPQPGPNMVYYPAPVPAILNLPPKLSKRPPQSEINKRRTQLLASGPKKTKSVGSMNGLLEADGEAGKVPPQLRANVFFEHPSVVHDLEIYNGSAVETLDRLLDAAADAPVSAFTDHPIIGKVGAEVYGRAQDARRRQSAADMLKAAERSEAQNRRSFLPWGGKPKKRMTTDSRLSMHMPQEATSEDDVDEMDENAALHQEAIEAAEDEYAREGDNAAEEDLGDNQPTTLLAELQMRKQQQKKRNRTAATAFPDGMRSTLLELDTVAQVQKQSRKSKHVTLAWEKSADQGQVDEDLDDEVPLGMLYPNGKPSINDMGGRYDEDRPLGLLAQKALEDNEPLSARRARLRGDQPKAPSSAAQDQATRMFNLEVPGVTTDATSDKEEEEETLAQRRQRLQNKSAGRKSRPISGDFASEMLSHFGVKEEQPAAVEQNKTPEEEETLGQRRKRLQAEAQRSREVSGETVPTANQDKRVSMADLLQAHPIGDKSAAMSRQSLPARGLIGSNTWHPTPSPTKEQPPVDYISQRQQTFGPGYYDRQSMPYVVTQPRRSSRVLDAQAHRKPGQIVNPMTYTPMMGLHNPVGAAPRLPHVAPMAEHMTMNPKQREMIDRWRQSVL